MTIQYASDLHLEFEENVRFLRENPLDIAGDILVLAGDTIYLGEKLNEATWFFHWCARNFKHTYLIPGNHEYYGGTPIRKTLSDFNLKLLENVEYVNNRSVVIDDTEIFFSTMWTAIPDECVIDVEAVMTDCRLSIYSGAVKFRTTQWNEAHKLCYQWLLCALVKSTAKHKIVVTHHCPHMNPEFRRYVGRMAETAYTTNLIQMLSGAEIEYWIHGHVHLPDNTVIGGTQILSNPLGYVEDGEHLPFKDNAAITYTVPIYELQLARSGHS